MNRFKILFEIRIGYENEILVCGEGSKRRRCCLTRYASLTAQYCTFESCTFTNDTRWLHRAQPLLPASIVSSHHLAVSLVICWTGCQYYSHFPEGINRCHHHRHDCNPPRCAHRWRARVRATNRRLTPPKRKHLCDPFTMLQGTKEREEGVT